MNNLTLELLSDTFNRVVSQESKELIDSFYVFGSLSRGEQISARSDIDSVLLLKDIDTTKWKAMKSLSADLINLDKELGIEIDHVIMTQIELFELLAPQLILGMYTDGVSIYGENLKARLGNYLDQCSKEKMLNSFLRSRMFYRHMFRKKILKTDLSQLNEIDDKQIISIAKDIFLAASCVCFILTGNYLSKKKDICSFFALHAKGEAWYINFPNLAYNVRYGIVSLSLQEKEKFIKDAFEFIEASTHQVIEEYQKLTGSDKLNLYPY